MKSNAVASSFVASNLAVIILGLCLAAPAQARRTAIDFDDTAIAIDGQSFSSDTSACGATDTADSSCRLNLFGDKSAGPIKLGFSIRIGTQLYDALYVNEAGIVTFGSAISPSGEFTAVADFAALQTHVPQPFIAPFYANLQTLDGTAPEDPFTVTNGGVMYGRGSADPTEPFSSAGLVPAFHVGWVEDTSISPAVATQVVIYFTGNTADADSTNNGDFAFRIRYGSSDTDEYNTSGNPTGIAGFSLGSGSDSRALTGALRAADDYFFRFHNGHISASATVSYTLTPSSINFGSRTLNTATQRNFSLANTGTAALPIGSIEIVGTDRALFTRTHNCGSSVAVGANCTIGVTFRPTSVGAKSANLRVVAGNNTIRNRALTGTGVRAAFSVSPTSLAFGNVARNTTSTPKTVTISNTGAGLLPISSISLGGANPGQFARSHNCPALVAVGGSCKVSVVFKPTSTGSKSAALIVTPGGGAAPKSVPLSGTGT
jgi:hypothetical protein